MTDRSTSTARAFRSALAAIGSVLAVSLPGHPDIEVALERLNVRIAASPADAELYLKRGELYAKHEEWIAAEANYLRAAELAPALPRLASARGTLALATGAPREARDHFDQALTLNPADAEALILRSRARARLADSAGAQADLDAALRLLSHPGPEIILERASLCASPREAIQTLDAAIARIGPVHTLQLRALELEEAAGLTDAALARLNSIAAHSERKEMWLKRAGDVLARAGRSSEARRAYAAALLAIKSLPSWLRESPDTTRLLAELKPLAAPSS